MNAVPLPFSVSIWTEPPSARTRETTASIPMPRPETSVTAAAVVKPGRDRILSSRSSLSSVVLPSTTPSLLAFFSTLARSIPWPSSSTRMATLERSRLAVRRMLASAGFLCFLRSAGDSMPWSTALRSRWSSGSPSSSSRARSSSISSPSTSNSTRLPSWRDRSRTTRGNRSKTCQTGVIRAWMISVCISATTRAIREPTAWSSGLASRATSSARRPLATTSSPTWFIRASSRRRSTRICLVRWAPSPAAAAAPARGSGIDSSPTSTASTSPAARMAWRTASSDSSVSRRRANRPSKSSCSNAAGAGRTDPTLPSVSALRRASSARAPRICAPGRMVTRTARPACPTTASGALAGMAQLPVGWLATAALSRSASSPLKSSWPSLPAIASATPASSASTMAKSRSCSSCVAAPGSLRSTSSRFSARWASSVRLPYPIAAAMPLKVCMARKIPTTGSVARGSRSHSSSS